MPTQAGDQTILALKKVGAIFLVFAGLGMTAVGINGGYTGWIVLGVLLVVAGAVLLVLKIQRRNTL